ncbi:DEAD/DEAH box helicase [Microbacterium invictum]|uniref:Superfamily II DNA or RNA helicase n=1 Tax=Microbacterium invictum TaxID=515415 RepID=A0AA40SN58_9MICO|nr:MULTISPECIES: DEAD/DEAH box helicase [Microbacterium]MBB4139182.1 superfamily II DNA or RNA helicase [Microbacterium invictum]
MDAVPAPRIDDQAIRDLTDDGAYGRGAAYARSGAVRHIAWDDQANTLTGLVAGSAAQLYRCTIRIDLTAEPPRIMSARCSCPMQASCKHTVATLLRSNAGGAASVIRSPETAPRPSPVTAPPRPPSWRDVLDPLRVPGAQPLALGLELRVRERAPHDPWGPQRLRTATARDLAGTPQLLVGMRPMARSTSTGAWVRSGVSWDSVRRDGRRFGDAQRRWFADLYGITRDVYGITRDEADWVTLDRVDSALLWPLLTAAAAHEIPLVSAGRRQEVALAGPAEIAVELAEASDGALRLTPRVTIAGEAADMAHVRAVGRTGVYLFETRGTGIHLTLAPVTLSETAHALLTASAEVTVPADEAGEFLREMYPRLARSGHVRPAPGLKLPPPEPTSLVVTVAFRPRDTIDYRLHWHRPGSGTASYDEADQSDTNETALRTGVQTAWARAAPLPFAAAATLAGVDAAEFAAHVLPALEDLDGVRLEVSGRRRTYRELTGDPRITVKTVESTDPDWFDLGVLVEIDGRRIPFTPLFTALATRRKKLLLSDGRFFSLAHPALDRLRELIDESNDLIEWEAGPKISRYQLPIWSDFEDLADEAEPAVNWRDTATALRTIDHIDPVPLPVGLHAELRPYQREGYDRLAFLWRHRLGGILADDMGLGKTLQILSLLARAREDGETRPFLVVAPTSVLSTWRDEAARFTPGLTVATIDATSAKRGRTVAATAASADIVVTSYTVLRLDEEEFAAVDWAVLVLDEAQFVKNANTKLHRAVAGLRTEVTIAVTGTPMENTLAELWALLSLTCPGLFPSARRFREEYIKPIEKGKVPENEEDGPYRARRLERLRRRIRPFMLRRTKDLVAKDLPPRQEQEVRVDLSPAHRTAYDTVLQRERQKVLGLLADLDRNRFIVFRSLTLLRMLALAPSLVDAGDPGIRSSKLDALTERLEELIAEGHRALVFSQFTSYLSLVQDALNARGIDYAYLDGSTRRRDEVIGGFRAGDAPVFLISLKSGGFGLTLTEADYVFLLDPWWNPATEAQAIDRTHRIGQDRPVNVYRLIAADTIEEKVVALQQRKARLFRAVLDDDDLFARSLTADDVRDLFDA